MTVTAVVVAGSRAGRLDTLTPVGGVPMIVRAVRGVLATGLVGQVIVLDVEARTRAVEHACADLPVSVLALFPVRTRPGRRAAAASEVVLLHDAARPLAPPGLAVAVVDAVRNGHAAAVPVLPLADTVKQVDGNGTVRATPDRSTLRVVQTPQAVRRDVLGAEAAVLPPAVLPFTALVMHATMVHTVPGHLMAFAVRTAWDLELAELLVGNER